MIFWLRERRILLLSDRFCRACYTSLHPLKHLVFFSPFGGREGGEISKESSSTENVRKPSLRINNGTKLLHRGMQMLVIFEHRLTIFEHGVVFLPILKLAWYFPKLLFEALGEIGKAIKTHLEGNFGYIPTFIHQHFRRPV